jgi:hypothetical protein
MAMNARQALETVITSVVMINDNLPSRSVCIMNFSFVIFPGSYSSSSSSIISCSSSISAKSLDALFAFTFSFESLLFCAALVDVYFDDDDDAVVVLVVLGGFVDCDEVEVDSSVVLLLLADDVVVVVGFNELVVDEVTFDDVVVVVVLLITLRVVLNVVVVVNALAASGVVSESSRLQTSKNKHTRSLSNSAQTSVQTMPFIPRKSGQHVALGSQSREQLQVSVLFALSCTVELLSSKHRLTHESTENTPSPLSSLSVSFASPSPSSLASSSQSSSTSSDTSSIAISDKRV